MQDLVNALNETRKQLNECLLYYKKSGRLLAEAERQYRIAFRQEVFRLHTLEGVAWTACSDLAKGDETVARLRFERDVKSDYECCYEKILQLKIELRILKMRSMQKGKECNFHQPGGTGENNTKEVCLLK